MKINRPDNSEPKFEKVISYLLMTGVILCILLEVIGVVLFYHAYGNLNISQQAGVFVKGHDFFSFIYRQLHNRQRRNTGYFVYDRGNCGADFDSISQGNRFFPLFFLAKKLEIRNNHPLRPGRGHAELDFTLILSDKLSYDQPPQP